MRLQERARSRLQPRSRCRRRRDDARLVCAPDRSRANRRSREARGVYRDKRDRADEVSTSTASVVVAAKAPVESTKRSISDAFGDDKENDLDLDLDSDENDPPAPAPPRQQPNRLSADAFMRHVLKQDIEEEGERLKRTRVHEKWEHAMMADASRTECSGEQRVRLMHEALDYLSENGFPWSKQQRIMFLGWLTTSYPSYYGDELNAHAYRLLKEMVQSEFRTECIVLAPRRNGKTVAVSGFAASELATQPDHDVLVYSNNLRASKMLLLQTYKMLKLLSAKFGGHIKSLNKNESLTYVTRDGYENEMFAYPAKPENLRGTGSKKKTGTVIAEEFAYMDVRVVFQIIGPTLTRKNVKFIGITTVNPNDSFVTPLVDAKFPDGRSVFLILNFDLVCAECRKAGKALQCRCLMADIPEWQSTTQHDKLALIMQTQTFLSEIKGISIDETISPAFHQVIGIGCRAHTWVTPRSDLGRILALRRGGDADERDFRARNRRRRRSGRRRSVLSIRHRLDH